MKNIDLAKKIKDLRNRKGYSQEQLAATSGLNLRTIQRIEAGETEPRGDTLQRLANSLDTSPDELLDWAEQEDNSYLMGLNLSALSFLAFPLLGIIVPLILWLMKKDKIKGVKETGRKLLNFQITFSMLFFVLVTSHLVFKIMHIQIPDMGIEVMNLTITELVVVVFPFFYYPFNLSLILINSFLLYKNKPVVYPLAIKWLK